MTSEQRLDRIERILETFATNQVAQQQAQLALTERMDTLTERMDSMAERMDSMAEHMDTLTVRMDILGQHVEVLTVNVNQLTTEFHSLLEIVIQAVQNAEADRAVIMENQAEIRRIWEYLLGQSSNGKGNNSDEGSQ